MSCIFSDTVVSECLLGLVFCDCVGVEVLPAGAVARDELCRIFPLNFQRDFCWLNLKRGVVQTELRTRRSLI
jgi:hypothetical protein